MRDTIRVLPRRVTVKVVLALAIFLVPFSVTAADSVEEAIAALSQKMEQAYNARDAAAMSLLWTEDAVHHSATTGEELKGRKAIADAYAKQLAEGPKSTLSISVRSVKTENADTATMIGVAQLRRPDDVTTSSVFEAKLTRTAAGWQIQQVQEKDLPLTSADALQPLKWLVGRWVDEQQPDDLVNRFQWMEGRSFLVRHYRFQTKDGTGRQGSQMFGWDAEQGCVRTWLFDASGCFGEGYWQREDESRWVNKLVLKFPDGRRGSLTQVLERVDADHIRLQLIDREIDGAAQPNGPAATLVRRADPARMPAESGNSKKGEKP